MKTCSFEGCEKPSRTRGFCAGHNWQQCNGGVLRPLRNRHTKHCVDCQSSEARWCPACERHLLLSEFGPHRGQKNNLSSWCRVCTRLAAAVDRATKRGFAPPNCTWFDVEEALYLQHGLCAACDNPYTSGEGVTATSWVIEHCHVTGKFRGIVHHVCNVSMGQANDDPKLLRKLADFLERTA